MADKTPEMTVFFGCDICHCWAVRAVNEPFETSFICEQPCCVGTQKASWYRPYLPNMSTHYNYPPTAADLEIQMKLKVLQGKR